jgi:hypothetical protein
MSAAGCATVMLSPSLSRRDFELPPSNDVLLAMFVQRAVSDSKWSVGTWQHAAVKRVNQARTKVASSYELHEQTPVKAKQKSWRERPSPDE